MERFASAGLLVAIAAGRPALTLQWDDMIHGEQDRAWFAQLALGSACDGIMLVAVGPLIVEIPGNGLLLLNEAVVVDAISREGTRAGIVRQVLRDDDGCCRGLAALPGGVDGGLELVSILDGIWNLNGDRSMRSRSRAPTFH